MDITGKTKLRKFKYVDDAGNKNFPWQRFVDGKWLWKLDGLIANVYGLESIKDNENLFCVEGEKDQQTMANLGFSCVTLPNGGGQKQWHDAYNIPFCGKNVYILSDNDNTGFEYQEFVAKNVHSICNAVYILDLSKVWKDIPPKADITDYLDKYGKDQTLQVIRDLCATATEWVPFLVEEKDVFASFDFYTVPGLSDEERKPPEFIVDGMIPCGMSILSGMPKIRKSFLALQLGIAVANGTPFFGHNTNQCDVCYFDLEGSKSRISSRTQNMTCSIPSNLFITNTVKEKLVDGLAEKIRMLHRQRPNIRFVIVDTYSRSRGIVKSIGMNAYDSDVSFLEPIQQMALQEDLALLFVHHDRKNAGMMSDSFERLSGSMGITGSADSVLNLIADGKRFDGRAKLEYCPRDAKGGEMDLVFSDRYTEWQAYMQTENDIMGNPVCRWIINSTFEYDVLPKREGVFFSYDTVFSEAYHTYSADPGDEIRRQIEANRNQLFLEYNLAVQLGVKSNGKRGIRIINLV